MDASTLQTFQLFVLGLQNWLLQQGWTGLRDIQLRASRPILDGLVDVVLSAATAGGKTEAYALPLLTRLAAQPGKLAVCIIPTKALANDQFERLRKMGAAAGVPVHRWHADVGQKQKQLFLDSPGGLLLITPESVQSLLQRHGAQGLFNNLLAVVVDELHCFVGTERGKQLQTLLHRLEVLNSCYVPRIALSATLGDISLAAEYLRPGGGSRAVCIEGTGAPREVRIQQRGYRRRAPSDKQEANDNLGDVHEIAGDLFRLLRGSDNLVFANSRANVELYADILRRRSEEVRVPNEFEPHHGSLSQWHREGAEKRLKDKSIPSTLVATTTVEMGLDVGDIQTIAQVGIPPSVPALQQRMGRSGRKEGEPAILRVFTVENDAASDSPQDALRAQTVQAAAMVLLMLEGQVEPPDLASLSFSTLVQQLLSLVVERGGTRPLEAWRILCEEGPFDLPDQASFAELLRLLGKKQVLSLVGSDELILGVEGERMVQPYTFLAAFSAPQEFKVRCGGKSLGSLPVTKPLLVDSRLILAGKRWRVLDVNHKSRVITVQPSPGGRPPSFDGGGIPVHGQVRARMRKVYLDDEVPPFLDATAAELLLEGRTAFRSLGLAHQCVVEAGGGCYFFPWVGDTAMNALGLLFGAHDLPLSNEGICLRAECSQQDFRRVAEDVVRAGLPSGPELARSVKNRCLGRYDHLLPERLQCLNYASSQLDVDGAAAALRHLLVGAVSHTCKASSRSAAFRSRGARSQSAEMRTSPARREHVAPT